MNEFDGNSVAWMADQDRENTASHQDQYKCDCGELVEEHEFIHELKVCRQCFEDKHGAGYMSIDEAEDKLGGVE